MKGSRRLGIRRRLLIFGISTGAPREISRSEHYVKRRVGHPSSTPHANWIIRLSRGKVLRHMLKIRMQRTGRINDPSYRLVVTEHTRGPRAGNIVEKVGTYNPKSKSRALNEDRLKYWMSVGAKPSATVHNMLVSLGLLNAKKINVLPAYKEPHKEEEAAVASPAESAAEIQAVPAAESPSAEEPTQEEAPAVEPSEEKPAE